jgi:hypothetical protein
MSISRHYEHPAPEPVPPSFNRLTVLDKATSQLLYLAAIDKFTAWPNVLRGDGDCGKRRAWGAINLPLREGPKTWQVLKMEAVKHLCAVQPDTPLTTSTSILRRGSDTPSTVLEPGNARVHYITQDTIWSGARAHVH